MAKVGRPKGSGSLYTEAISIAICDLIAEGVTMRQACRDLSLNWSTVYDWRDAHPEFAALLARARDRGEDAIVIQCMEIADTPLPGVETTTKANGDTEEKRGDMLGHRKLQIDTRLKLLAIWNPGRFGPKIEQTVKGPVNLVVSGSDVHG